MSPVYESLKVMVQDTLQRGKTDPAPSGRFRGSNALGLNDELEELEKFFSDRVNRLRTAVKDRETVIAGEAQNAKQLVEDLRVNIAALESKLKEMVETVQRNQSARQKMEETLNSRIQELENDLKQREQMLESRRNEINDLKANLDGRVKHVAELELALQKAKDDAATEAGRAERLTGSFKAKIAALELQLRDSENMVRQKESAIKVVEEKLTAKIEEMDRRLRSKEELLVNRDAEINDLKSQLKRLANGIGGMSALFRQAEALAAIDDRDVANTGTKEPFNRGKETAATLQPKPVTNAPREIVAPEVFHRISDVLSDLTKVMSPIASIIVRDHVIALGESIENFPKARLSELLESLVKEIAEESVKVDFRKRLSRIVQNNWPT
jgi:chromosome segregation ATPase